MPHAPATHLTVTPKRVYINGEPVSVMKDTLELSTPSPTEAQTVTLTICPTSVTILNSDNQDEIDTIRSTHADLTKAREQKANELFDNILRRTYEGKA